jgi:hypothetical protein
VSSDWEFADLLDTDELLNLVGSSIEEVVPKLTKLFYDKLGASPYSINNGFCEIFGSALEFIFPDAKGHWGNELLTEDEASSEVISDIYAYHYVVELNGLYYDSENPFGCDDFRDIAAFHTH